MKYLFSCLLFVIYLLPAASGQITDIMVRNTISHEIRNADTLHFTCNQKTYDNNNRLVLERHFDGKAQKQDGFTWYFYNPDNKMKSVEGYNMDKNPKVLKQIQYTKSGDTLKIIVYTGGKDTVIKTSEKNYIYSSKGVLKQTKTLSANNKSIERAKYYYNSGIKSPVKIVVSNKSETPFKESMNIEYNAETGLPKTSVKNIEMINDKTIYTNVVSYNSKGFPLEEKVLVSGKLIKKKTFDYAADIELVKYVEEDGNGKVTGWYTVDTYFHKADLSVIKSYFE
jgi:hypothetical protein